MKIDPVFGQQAIHKYQKVQQPVSAPSTYAQKSDELDLSTNAVSFASVLKAAKAAEFVRSPQENMRLSEISKQIENGTYQIEGRKVAEKMLESIGLQP